MSSYQKLVTIHIFPQTLKFVFQISDEQKTLGNYFLQEEELWNIFSTNTDQINGVNVHLEVMVNS